MKEDAAESMVRENINAKPANASHAFANTLQAVDDCGKWQWRLMLITSFCGIFAGLHNFAAVFLAAKPDHWCQIPYMSSNASYAKEMQNITTPWVRGNEGDMVLSQCTYFNQSIDPSEGKNSSTTVDVRHCSSWYYDTSIFQSTVVSEWNLVCSKQWLMPTTQSTYMLGILAGAVIFSAISDRWGRRPVSLLCAVILFVSSNLVPFSTSISIFLLLRFLVAASGQGLYLVTFILLMECLGTKGRNILGNLFHVGFTVGFCLFSLAGYYVRDWRYLQMSISIPTVLLLLYFWILPESPRWLMMQGRQEESLNLLTKIARTNKRELPRDNELQKILSAIEIEAQLSPKQSATRKLAIIWESLITLVRTPNMRRRNLITFYAWFVTSMMYYGLAFNGANINASIHVNVFLAGIVEFPAIFLTILIISRFGRRPALFLAMTSSGISCVGIAFVPTHLVWLNILFSTIGKFMSSSAFCIIFMFSAELVPTNVRNISIGIASMWGRIGSAICPYIVDLLGAVYYAIPSTIFGVAAITSGLLILLLPETGNKRLPESVEEVESMPK